MNGNPITPTTNRIAPIQKYVFFHQAGLGGGFWVTNVNYTRAGLNANVQGLALAVQQLHQFVSLILLRVQ